jgi:hypothetical protein
MRKLVWAILILVFLMWEASGQPVITVDHHTVPENPSVGYFILSVDLTNSGSYARNIELEIYEEEDNLALIDKNKEVSRLHLDLGDLSAGATSATFKIFAKESGIYQLKLKLKYNYFSDDSGFTSNTGKLVSEIDTTIAIIVADKPSFVVGGDVVIKPSESKIVDLMIRNAGGNARDVTISFETPKGVVASPNMVVERWNSGEERNVPVQLIVDGEVKVGAYTLMVKISYNDEFGNKYTDEIPVALEIYGNPRLVLSGFSLTPERIYPDSEFVLNVSLENVGTDEAKNIKARLDFPEVFFGEREKFLGSLSRDNVIEEGFTLKAEKNTASGSHLFTLYVEYESSHGDKYYESYEFPVFVSSLGIISLDIAGVYTSPQAINPEDMFKLSLQIENSGNQDAKAVSVKLLLPDGFEGRESYFIGSLESGDSATATFELKAGDAGKHNIKAVVSYMDSRFEKYEIVEEFSIYVFPKSYSWMYPAIALLAILGVFYYWRTRKK